MLKRLSQFDGDHHSDGETVVATPRLSKLLLPGSKAPVSLQSFALASAQLRPMIGMTTTEQGTALEQPSASFSWLVRTSKSARPLPSVPVKAAISLVGSTFSAEAAGGIVFASQPA